MLKETETEEAIVFCVTFLSLVAFPLEGAPAPPPPGCAYDYICHCYFLSTSAKKLRVIILTAKFQAKTTIL